MGGGAKSLQAAPLVRASKERPRARWASWLITGGVFLMFAAVLVLFFRYDRSDALTRLILRSGALGIVVGILLMALLSILPVPSEFLMIVIMKIFGPWWGGLYSWVGTMTAAIVTFYLARSFGQRLLRLFISEKRFHQVANWIGNRGVLGLLVVRFVPLPFIVVNYTAGVSPSVKPWNYIWTSAVGGIPYYIGAALVFLGVSRKYMVWLVVGGIAVILIWISGYIYNHYVQMMKRWAH